MTFEYDRIMEENGELSEDDWYELENNNADTIWYFYYGMIFDSFSLPDFEQSNQTPTIAYLNDKRNAYYIYENSYDPRLYAKAYSPTARIDWNEQFANSDGTDRFDEEDATIIYEYYLDEEKLASAGLIYADGDKTSLIPIIKRNGIVYVVPTGFLDKDEVNMLQLQEGDGEFCPEEMLLPLVFAIAHHFYPFTDYGNYNFKTGSIEETEIWPDSNLCPYFKALGVDDGMDGNYSI